MTAINAKGTHGCHQCKGHQWLSSMQRAPMTAINAKGTNDRHQCKGHQWLPSMQGAPMTAINARGTSTLHRHDWLQRLCGGQQCRRWAGGRTDGLELVERQPVDHQLVPAFPKVHSFSTHFSLKTEGWKSGLAGVDSMVFKRLVC